MYVGTSKGTSTYWFYDFPESRRSPVYDAIQESHPRKRLVQSFLYTLILYKTPIQRLKRLFNAYKTPIQTYRKICKIKEGEQETRRKHVFGCSWRLFTNISGSKLILKFYHFKFVNFLSKNIYMILAILKLDGKFWGLTSLWHHFTGLLAKKMRTFVLPEPLS